MEWHIFHQGSFVSLYPARTTNQKRSFNVNLPDSDCLFLWHCLHLCRWVIFNIFDIFNMGNKLYTYVMWCFNYHIQHFIIYDAGYNDDISTVNGLLNMIVYFSRRMFQSFHLCWFINWFRADRFPTLPAINPHQTTFAF